MGGRTTGAGPNLYEQSSGDYLGTVDRDGREVLIPRWVDENRDRLADESGTEILLWDDLRFPSQGINPAGSAAPPAVDDVLTSFPGTLLFSGTLENVIAGVAQMPHAWAPGTTIKPHIHWSKPVGSANAVDWVFYYRKLGFAGDAAEAWVGPIAGTLAVGDPTVTDEHLITSFGDVAMTGYRESTCFNWQIRRLGNTDADSGTARLYEFDVHYQVSKHGTVSDIPEA
jgi:hypothetical protein